LTTRWSNPACTARHRNLQRKAHAELPDYGVHGYRWVADVLALAKPGDTILDYGCGKGTFAKAMAGRGFTVTEYDPGIPGKDALPAPADVVVCTDVLPFIEPGKVAAVAEHIRGLAERAAFIAVPYHPEAKLALYPDVIRTQLEPAEWQALFPDAEARMIGDNVKRTKYLVLSWGSA
jgi:hypothetical protein